MSFISEWTEGQQTAVHTVNANNQQPYLTDGSEHSWPRPD